MGPVGALIGGVIGAVVAYQNSDDYEVSREYDMHHLKFRT